MRKSKEEIAEEERKKAEHEAYLNRFTDVEYCAERNKLIPKAVEHANNHAKSDAPIWSKFFSRRMDFLWAHRNDVKECTV